MFFVCCMCVCD